MKIYTGQIDDGDKQELIHDCQSEEDFWTLENDEEDVCPKYIYKPNYEQNTLYKKVYSILFIQLLIAASMTTLFLYTKAIHSFVKDHGLLFLCVTFFTAIIALFLFISFRHTFPSNLILLFLFTVIDSVVVAITVTLYELVVMLQTLLIATVLFFLLTVFAITAPDPLKQKTAWFIITVSVMVTVTLIQIVYTSTILDLFLACAGTILFAGFVVYDTHKLKCKRAHNEFILAALHLHLDFVNFFLYLLQITRKLAF